MSEKYVTEDMLTKALKANTDEIIGVIYGFMGHVDEKFEKTDMAIFKLQRDVSEIKIEVSDLKQNLDKLLSTMDRYLDRIETNELEQAARDAQFDRLMEWAKKVSEKTGIPLEIA